MRKRTAFIILIFFSAFLLYAALVSKEYHKEITIKTSLLKIHNQLSYIDYIAKWYLPFANADSSRIKITGKEKITCDYTALDIVKLEGLSSLFKITEKGTSKEVLFSLKGITETNQVVTLSYKNTLWNKLFVKNSIINDAEKSLQHLKDYIEDTRTTYGYKIETTEVKDTTFLFTSKIVAKNDKKETLKKLYEILIHYANEKDAGYKGVRILYLIPMGKDSIGLSASIGITKHTEQMPLDGNITLRRMPYKRNLIVADYEGRFGNIDNLFAAMERYRTDNNLTSMAIPFVKFEMDSIDFDDSEIIKAKGFFPIL